MTTHNAAGDEAKTKSMLSVRTLCQYRFLAALTSDPTITTQEALTQHHLGVLQQTVPPRRPRSATTRRTTATAASHADDEVRANVGPEPFPGQ